MVAVVPDVYKRKKQSSAESKTQLDKAAIVRLPKAKHGWQRIGGLQNTKPIKDPATQSTDKRLMAKR